MSATPDTLFQAQRARQTIWRRFNEGNMSANTATARLLAVDLALRGRATRPQPARPGFPSRA
jgi:hypothetical protein